MKKEKIVRLLRKLDTGEYVSRYHCKILLDMDYVVEEKIKRPNNEKGRPSHKYHVSEKGQSFIQQNLEQLAA